MSVVDPGTAAGGIALAIAGIFAMFDCQCQRGGNNTEVDDTAIKDSEVDSVLEASEEAAKKAADEMAADAAARDKLAMDFLSGKEQQLGAEAQRIKDEMDAYNKQWQEAQQGIDPKDPGYDNFKKQYDDYQDYLKNQLNDVNSQMNEIEAARIQEQMAQESKSDWVKQQQQDLIQVAEQKSYLEAVAKGYGAEKGYNIDEVNARLKQLNERENELKNTLKANNAEIDYTPKERDPIGPDADSKRLQEEYRARKEALEQETARAKAEENAARRAELAKEQKWLEKDMKNQASKAAFWNFMTKTAETTQVAADVGVDILSNLTGPVGKSIKVGYSGLKGLGSGVGNALSKIDKDSLKDPYTLGEDMSKELLKGSVGGVTDMAKDMVGDKFGNAAKNIFTVGSESFKGGLEAGLDGKSVVDGAIGGGLKGGMDVGLSAGLDKLIPPGEMPKGLDWSDMNASTVIKSLKGKNPLTVRSLGREAAGEGLTNLGKDQFKNFVKGDEVLNSGWKQNFTGDLIEKAGTPLIKAAPGMAMKGAKSMAETVQNAVNNPGVITA